MGTSKSKKRKRDRNLHLVFADETTTFWEVDAVLDRRVKGREVQYLIKWKGLGRAKATWEPSDNLCDSALEEARALDRIALENNPREWIETSEDDDNSQVAHSASRDRSDSDTDHLEVDKRHASKHLGKPTTSNPEFYPPPPLEDGRWRWTHEEQVLFREVDRINVNDANAKQIVTDARLNGTPIVLVGHVGWANFAKKWLVLDEAEPSEGEKLARGGDEESEWLDLSKNFRLDINKMIVDIGNDLVPVVDTDYNEQNPLQAKMKLSAFLKTCWPHSRRKQNTDSNLYLHQWQFPLSATAGRKLCHKNRSLPNQILGDDLLKFWLDLRHCKMDSALQYLFMGSEGTMSKLHRDNGGLAISIAPIVGVKECVLVHRSDGAPCLYHLDASLDNIDLDEYPLMAHARIWKTSIKPGEILLMPQGTYHQCRNLTPCLSYSRFHLDTVNLLPFLQSMVDGDAQEIDHAEIIWNSSNEVMNAVDIFVEMCRSCVAADPPKPCPDLSDEIVEKVDTLRSLRIICREVVRRLENQKGKSSQRNEIVNNIGTRADWNKMVNDIDDSLHHFRYRTELKIPSRPRKKRSRDGENRSLCHVGGSSNRIDANDDFASNMEAALANLERRSRFRSQARKPMEEEIRTSDYIVVRLQKREALGTVVAIEEKMHAAYLTYDGFPSIYDEYQPYEKLRLSVGGENVELSADAITEGKKVVNRWGETGEEYWAIVARTCCQRFFSVRLHLSPTYHLDRWFPIDDIVSWANLKAGGEN